MDHITIKKIRELDEENLLNDDQRRKIKTRINQAISEGVDISDNDLVKLIKFAGLSVKLSRISGGKNG